MGDQRRVRPFGATPHHTIAALLLPLLLAACALTGAPYPDLSRPPEASPCPPPQLALVEGQPRGLLLRLTWPGDHATTCPAADRVALLRQVQPDASSDFTDYDVHHTVELAAEADGTELLFLDQAVEPGRTYRYLLTAADGDGVILAAAEPTSVAWTAPPPPPLEVEAVPVGQHIHVTWEGVGAQGALVFRRELGAADGFQRVSPVLPPGAAEFVDGAIRPGAVYTYMVSGARFDGRLPMLGPPSPEVYVEAMGPP